MTVRAVPRLRDLHPSLRLRIAVGFAERFLNTMMVPLITIFLASHVGALKTGGLLLAAVLVAACAGLAAGYVADRHGRRRALIGSAAVMTAGFAMMAGGVIWHGQVWPGQIWHGQVNVAIVYAGYLVQAAADSFVRPVHDAVLLDVTVPEQRRFVYAFNYWSINAALGAGALVGTFLYGRHFFALLAGAAGVLLAATVLTIACFAETAQPRRREKDSLRRQLSQTYLTPLRDRRFIGVVLAMTLILGMEMQRTGGYIGVHIAGQHRQTLISAGPVHLSVTGVELLGVVQAGNTIAIVVAALFAERLLRHMSDRWRINLGIGLFAACCVVLSTADLGWVLLAGILVLTVGELMHIPAMQAVLARSVPDDLRAGYMAVFNLNIRGGMMIAALSLTAAPVLGTVGIAVSEVVLGGAAIVLYAPLVRRPGDTGRLTTRYRRAAHV